jgi:hypothetical protein
VSFTRILGPLACVMALTCSCAQQADQAVSMPTVGPSGHRNVVALVSATVQDDGSARAQAYGVFATGDDCVTARNWYLKQSPEEFQRPKVDFACVQDAYDVMPWVGSDKCGPSAVPCNPDNASTH